MCTPTPSASTPNACGTPPGPLITNITGRIVETSDPKNGTMAASPVNTPNVSQ
jgi:hypothetical protein